jgi:hypothetical protein
MTGDLFVLVALGSLLLFILWEILGNRRSVLKRRARAPEGFMPGGAAHEVGLFVLAATFVACSALVLVSPELVTSGRHAYLFNILISCVGTFAPPLLFLGTAAGVFFFGIVVRKRRLEQTRGDHAG